ncbi:MAG TPA: 5-(carboxyamino)imidazole ribonucleotide mutase [Methanomassiliicoccales archaeon]|jgi:5-(carboxyamino)imidazole ribonucleotide mutase|nr:5-(carboxyamino)imidazole ribonucleotide mutase [Methanomassiliicoccales archaeon]HOE52116.1 5-(carboxyamino)imidazole ribonucleotide mutase [Methanomassiliicoccales archaeon]HOO03656.1 5-(carboxyamino)imidazole ribonucleotide mutase [Methanomassiliicoccales archaeon]HPD08519.1 5-(carboxyamino)imidazole ribonucleotide mutase [Methanomassiliicoccales archaeon]HQM67017.1 5-(carboxyamino)imidazole ribonucleotide mutase [Methanomassiliicoccales archaeon]
MASVLVILGSKSDAEVGRRSMDVLGRFGVEAKMVVASAHRTPDRVKALVEGSGADVFIAIAGLAAALPGMVAAFTTRPVIGVPVAGKLGLDSLLSIVQMPPGVPVACVGLDRGDNAALLAVAILSLADERLAEKLASYRRELAERVERDSNEVQA